MIYKRTQIYVKEIRKTVTWTNENIDRVRNYKKVPNSGAKCSNWVKNSLEIQQPT